MISFVWLLWLGSGLTYRTSDVLVWGIGTERCGFDRVVEGEIHREAFGQLGLSGSRNGILLAAEKPVYVSFSDQKRSTLPEIDLTGLPVIEPQMRLPFLAGRDSVAIWFDDRWVTVAWSIWVDLQAPQPEVGTRHGYRLWWPTLLDCSPGVVMSYQPKSGQLRRIELARGLEREWTVPDRLKLVRIGDRSLWVGWPDERVALIDPAEPERFIDTLKIADLTRHSPVLAGDQELWILTFGDGIGDLLNGWRHQEMDLALHRVTVEKDRLKHRSVKLPDVPVGFALSQSASGSPKLKPHSRFDLVPVGNGRRLGIVADRWIRLVDPARDQVETFQRKWHTQISGLWSDSGKVLVLSADGNRQVLTR